MSDQEPTLAWHLLETPEVLRRLDVDPARGLSAAEAAERLAAVGPNEILEAQPRGLWRLFLDQFRDFMILVLLAAAVISGLIGDAVDTLAILVIVLLNAVIGTVQEYRAARAVAALKAMAAAEAQVLREGARAARVATALVPGDVVYLEAGNVVPADLRLIDCAELEINEAALTGESVGVQKTSAALAAETSALGERLNIAFKGTQINRGRAQGVVIATGMATEIGRIATLLHEVEEVKTPLQKRLAAFGRRLALAVLAICAVIFVVGLLRGEPLALMLLTAISLAVAAIPEALPAVISVSLALGARKMSRSQALIRNLPAVETLGSVTFICSDKTGTLTQNKMHVDRLHAAGAEHDALPPTGAPLWQHVGQALALSNDVEWMNDTAIGDPTELALYQAAQTAGFDKRALAARLPRRAEVAFTSERQRMSTVHQTASGLIAYCKGSPEAVLPLCTQQQEASGITVIDRAALLQQAEALAARGYRVLALAYRPFEALPQDDIERDLIFLALIALIDPPREEAAAAVAECLSAGIRPVMITGDHPATARAIAARVGIDVAHSRVLTGEDLARLPDEELARIIREVQIYARVSPAQKIRIVQALQAAGEFCAMTGDGVNDAPALHQADIGVAMGRKGTDVAREAADMVLLDDNFATIVTAVREGRRIFDNIRKFIKYTMTSNSGEIWTLFLAPFLGLPIPLLPVHILWINLVTDGLPGLALAAEPAERGIMQRPPRRPNESIFAHGMWQHIVWVGLLIGGVSLLAQAWAVRHSPAYWQTMVFTTLTLAQLGHALAIRSERDSLFRLGLLSNRPLLGAVVLTLGLQLAVIYLPWFNEVFHTQPLPLRELLICVGLAVVVPVAVEIEKWLVRHGRLYRASVETG